jgi:putative spermidine/putrescine transport system permease protein
MNPPPGFRYPLSWRLMDGLEWLADRCWPPGLSRYTGWLLVTPALLLVASLVVGMIGIADNALRQLDTETFRMSEHYTLENFRTAFSAGVYLNIMWRSLLAALLTTVLTLILAFPYAYVMVRTPSAVFRKTLLIALFLPFFIGQVVRAYGWLIILGNDGIINHALGILGLGPYRFLFNFPAVVFGLVQYMLPFAVLMLAPALTAIPEEVETAAKSLGASWPKAMRHVVLPMARPGLIGAGLVVLTLSLTDFAMPAMLGGGSQDFIANAIYDQYFRTSDMGLGAALAVILVTGGTMLVGLILAVFGAGTLAMGRRAP